MSDCEAELVKVLLTAQSPLQAAPAPSGSGALCANRNHAALSPVARSNAGVSLPAQSQKTRHHASAFPRVQQRPPQRPRQHAQQQTPPHCLTQDQTRARTRARTTHERRPRRKCGSAGAGAVGENASATTPGRMRTSPSGYRCHGSVRARPTRAGGVVVARRVVGGAGSKAGRCASGVGVRHDNAHTVQRVAGQRGAGGRRWVQGGQNVQSQRRLYPTHSRATQVGAAGGGGGSRSAGARATFRRRCRSSHAEKGKGGRRIQSAGPGTGDDCSSAGARAR